MLKIIFQILGVIGFICICTLSFIIPNNPYEIISTPNYSLPLFIYIIIGVGSLYLIILYGVYCLIDNRIYKPTTSK